MIIKQEELEVSDVEESELNPEMSSFIQNNIKKTKAKKYKCVLCPATFTSWFACNTHINTHTKQRKYDCSQCPAVFYRKSTAYEHWKAHDKFKATGVTCPVCSVWCKTLKSLEFHKKTHAVRHKCDICPKTFQFVKNLLVHKAVIHNKNGQLSCPFCEYKCINKRLLLPHVNTHTREHKYRTTCTTCGERFSCWKSLKTHNEKLHQPKKEFHCDLCSSVFDTSVGLKDHRNRQHLLERRYICELCGKGFVFANYLSKHMIAHSDERKFQCTVCGMKFKRMGDLNKHLKTHADK